MIWATKIVAKVAAEKICLIEKRRNIIAIVKAIEKYKYGNK